MQPSTHQARRKLQLPARAVSALILTAGLAACTQVSPRPQLPAIDTPRVTIKGQLAYRERIALPPHARAQVTLVDTSVADRAAPMVARKIIDTEGRQVPLPFELEVPRANLQPNHRYSLRGTISGPDGKLSWTTDTAHIIDRDKPVNDLGTLWLVRAGTGASTALALPYKARGNEPGWVLTLDDGAMSLDWSYGGKHVRMPLPQPRRSGDGLRYVASTGAHRLDAHITHAICRDSMTGMPYPDKVTVQIDGETLQGCGGDPKSLLTGHTWLVEDIAGGGVIDSSHVTIQFDPDGQLSGSGGCNRYHGQYELTGENLATDRIASTLMACVPALDQQERRFLDVLNHALGFDITDTGKLVIHSDSGQTLRASPQ